MLTFTSDDLRGIVKDAEPGNAQVTRLVDSIDFYTFGDLEGSVKNEVKYLQEHPLVLKGTKVTGWVCDVRSGIVS
jgi:carbonic anhydrase